MTFPLAFVATTTKYGVSTYPCLVVNIPTLALEFLSFLIILNGMIGEEGEGLKILVFYP